MLRATLWSRVRAFDVTGAPKWLGAVGARVALLLARETPRESLSYRDPGMSPCTRRSLQGHYALMAVPSPHQRPAPRGAPLPLPVPGTGQYRGANGPPHPGGHRAVAESPGVSTVGSAP